MIEDRLRMKIKERKLSFAGNFDRVGGSVSDRSFNR